MAIPRVPCFGLLSSEILPVDLTWQNPFHYPFFHIDDLTRCRAASRMLIVIRSALWAMRLYVAGIHT